MRGPQSGFSAPPAFPTPRRPIPCPFPCANPRPGPGTHWFSLCLAPALAPSAGILSSSLVLIPTPVPQAVKSGDGGKEKRRTVGKLHLNMAQFCTDRMDAKPQEMMLQLK